MQISISSRIGDTMNRRVKIACGIELEQQGNKCFWISGGKTIEFSDFQSFEQAVQTASEYHADGRCKVMGDPLYYVDGAAEKF